MLQLKLSKRYQPIEQVADSTDSLNSGVQSTLPRCKSVIIATLGASLLAIVTTSLLYLYRLDHRVPSTVSLSESNQFKVFQETAFAKAPGNDEETWGNILPLGKGFIIPPELDPHKPPNTSDTACISVFHQLHCLSILRTTYYDTKEGRLVPEHLEGHMGHCFDYLRQAIMCASDMSLEWVAKDDDGTDGWNATHKCRNFDAVKDWATEHRSTNNTR